MWPEETQQIEGPDFLQVLAGIGEEEGGATTWRHTRRPTSVVGAIWEDYCSVVAREDIADKGSGLATILASVGEEEEGVATWPRTRRLFVERSEEALLEKTIFSFVLPTFLYLKKDALLFSIFHSK